MVYTTLNVGRLLDAPCARAVVCIGDHEHRPSPQLSKVTLPGVEGAGLVPCVGGPPVASVGFYVREAFQSQTITEKILYNKSR